MKKQQSEYSVKKVGDNWGLFFRGQIVESGIFASRKTALKHKAIGEHFRAERLRRKAL